MFDEELSENSLFLTIGIVVIGLAVVILFLLLGIACGTKKQQDPRRARRRSKVRLLLLPSGCLKPFDVKKVAPYSKRRKLLLSFSLLWVAVFFSKGFTEMLTGKSWGLNISNICSDYTEKLEVIRNETRSYIKYDEALEQYSTVLELREDGWELGSEYTHAGLTEPWPNACNVSRATDAVIASKLQTCTESERYCADAGDFFNVFIKDKHQCVNVDVPYSCPGEYAESDQSTLERYTIYESEKSGTLVITIDPTSYEDVIASMLDLLLLQIDTACNLYVGWIVALLWIAAPAQLWKSGFVARLKRGWCEVNQVQFVILVVLLWNTYTYFVIPLKTFDLSMHITNFMTDPCYVEPTFCLEKADIISELCSDVKDIESNFTKVGYSFTDMKYYAELYDVCFPNLCAATECKDSCPDCTVEFWENGINFVESPFVGNCNTTVKAELIEKYSSPYGAASTNTWGVLITSGLLAQMFIKIVITNMVLNWYKFWVPWMFHNGNVEVVHMKQDLDLESISWWLRWKNFFPAVFWTVFSAGCLISLAMTIRSEDLRVNELSREQMLIAGAVTLPVVIVLFWELHVFGKCTVDVICCRKCSRSHVKNRKKVTRMIEKYPGANQL